MIFSDPDDVLTYFDIEKIQSDLGLNFPISVVNAYLKSNGGSPEKYVFTNDSIDTVVSEFLPLTSKKNSSVFTAYNRLVIGLRLVRKDLLPFAIDGGGDYFFVDCNGVNDLVYYYRSDTSKERRLVNLNLNFEDFWKSLLVE